MDWYTFFLLWFSVFQMEASSQVVSETLLTRSSNVGIGASTADRWSQSVSVLTSTTRVGDGPVSTSIVTNGGFSEHFPSHTSNSAVYQEELSPSPTLFYTSVWSKEITPTLSQHSLPPESFTHCCDKTEYLDRESLNIPSTTFLFQTKINNRTSTIQSPLSSNLQISSVRSVESNEFTEYFPDKSFLHNLQTIRASSSLLRNLARTSRLSLTTSLQSEVSSITPSSIYSVDLESQNSELIAGESSLTLGTHQAKLSSEGSQTILPTRIEEDLVSKGKSTSEVIDTDHPQISPNKSRVHSQLKSSAGQGSADLWSLSQTDTLFSLSQFSLLTLQDSGQVFVDHASTTQHETTPTTSHTGDDTSQLSGLLSSPASIIPSNINTGLDSTHFSEVFVISSTVNQVPSVYLTKFATVSSFHPSSIDIKTDNGSVTNSPQSLHSSPTYSPFNEVGQKADGDETQHLPKPTNSLNPASTVQDNLVTLRVSTLFHGQVTTLSSPSSYLTSLSSSSPLIHPKSLSFAESPSPTVTTVESPTPALSPSTMASAALEASSVYHYSTQTPVTPTPVTNTFDMVTLSNIISDTMTQNIAPTKTPSGGFTTQTLPASPQVLFSRNTQPTIESLTSASMLTTSSSQSLSPLPSLPLQNSPSLPPDSMMSPSVDTEATTAAYDPLHVTTDYHSESSSLFSSSPSTSLITPTPTAPDQTQTTSTAGVSNTQSSTHVLASYTTGGVVTSPPQQTTTTSGGGATSDTAPSGSDQQSEILIGSAAAVFLLAIIVLGAIFCVRCRKRRKAKPQNTDHDDLWVDNYSNAHQMMPLPSLTCTTEIDTPSRPARRENIYTVAFPYESQQEGQMSLDKGDKLQLVETAENGWWRGVSLKQGNSGWFPSGFVTAAKADSTEDIPGDPGDEAPNDVIDGSNTEAQVSSFQIKKSLTEEDLTDTKKYPNVGSTDGLNDVESWVNMAASISMASLPTTELSYNTNLTDFATAMTGHTFRVVYAYKPLNRGEMGLREGELLTCQERDRNGWMLGRKSRTGEQGWFPTVYVDEVSSDDEYASDPEIPDTYDLLDSNKHHKPDQMWIGIDHKVIFEFISHVPGDLALSIGDTITVLQTLANGWWFGIKDTDSGWFPGTFVELIEDKSETPQQPENHYTAMTSKEVAALLLSGLEKSGTLVDNTKMSSKHSTLPNGSKLSKKVAPQPKVRTAKENDKTNGDPTALSPTTETESLKVELRPNRKAPPPPSSARTSAVVSETGSDNSRRPARRAPAPPPGKKPEPKQRTTKTGGNQSLVDGKKPVLKKISRDCLNEKHLNPMIRPATRSFMARPTDSSRDIWESRPEKRLLENRTHIHSNRASSNLGSQLSSPIHDWSSVAGASDITSPSSAGYPSTTSPLSSNVFLASSTPTGVELSRTSSIGSSLNSKSTLSPHGTSNAATLSVSDISGGTLTNMAAKSHSTHNNNNNEIIHTAVPNITDNKSEDGADDRTSRQLDWQETAGRNSRSRSRSPAIFPAPPSGLVQNAQRFKHLGTSASPYSSDVSDTDSISDRNERMAPNRSVSNDLPKPPSLTTSHSLLARHSPQQFAGGTLGKKQGRRHRTMTTVAPPSVPLLILNNAPQSVPPKSPGDLDAAAHRESPTTNVGNGDTKGELNTAVRQRVATAVITNEGNSSSKHTHYTSAENHSPIASENNIEYSSHEKESFSTETQQNQTYVEGDGANNVETLDPAYKTQQQPEDNTTIRDLPLRVPSPAHIRPPSTAAHLTVEDSAPARNSLKQVVPGTVSDIVDQINRLTPVNSDPCNASGSSSPASSLSCEKGLNQTNLGVNHSTVGNKSPVLGVDVNSVRL